MHQTTASSNCHHRGWLADTLGWCWWWDNWFTWSINSNVGVCTVHGPEQGTDVKHSAHEETSGGALYKVNSNHTFDFLERNRGFSHLQPKTQCSTLNECESITLAGVCDASYLLDNKKLLELNCLQSPDSQFIQGSDLSNSLIRVVYKFTCVLFGDLIPKCQGFPMSSTELPNLTCRTYHSLVHYPYLLQPQVDFDKWWQADRLKEAWSRRPPDLMRWMTLLT